MHTNATMIRSSTSSQTHQRTVLPMPKRMRSKMARRTSVEHLLKKKVT